MPEWPADKRIWGPHRPPCKITSAAHGTGRGARDYESHLLRSAILRRDLTTRTAFPRGPRLGRSCLLNKLMGRFGPRRTGPAGPLLLQAKPTTKPPASRYTPNRPGPPRWLRCRPRGDMRAAVCGTSRNKRAHKDKAQVGIPFLPHLGRKAQRPSSPDIRRQ